MPDFTPAEYSGEYALYEGKAASGIALSVLIEKLAAVGYRIGAGRGDYNGN